MSNTQVQRVSKRLTDGEGYDILMPDGDYQDPYGALYPYVPAEYRNGDEYNEVEVEEINDRQVRVKFTFQLFDNTVSTPHNLKCKDFVLECTHTKGGRYLTFCSVKSC